MKIYNYSQSTSEYMGCDTADESPLEPGVFLLPQFATFDEPPETISGKLIKYIGGAWVYEDEPVMPIVEPIPSEQRKTEYATRRCIALENDTLTIDAANLLYAAYLAEGDTAKAAAIQTLIIEQKTAIRAEIPDSEL